MLTAVKSALLSLCLLGTPVGISSCFHRTVIPDVGLEIPVQSADFAPSLATTTGTPWLSGNHVRTLPNGDAFFPPMIEAIRKARQTITFETFAFVEAPITRDVTQALCERAREGVAVHMILDHTGSRKAGKANIKALREAGVDLHFFHPFNPLFPKRTNNRTHRKILVVDGEIAFTGGAGFAHAWSGNAHSPEHWRDTQYEIKGPAVAPIQQSFAENWHELTGVKLQGPSYFPPLQSAGPYRVQVLSDGPNNHAHPIAHSYLAAINGARKSLVMEQSYFIPTTPFRKALLRAAKRGVKIEVLVPSKLIDSKPARYASQNHWRILLEHGIRIYEYEPTMMHAKLLVADDRLSIIGSSNFDDRSFFINDEINLHVDSPGFAREQLKMIRHDLTKAREITLENLHTVLAPGYKRFFIRLIESQF